MFRPASFPQGQSPSSARLVERKRNSPEEMPERHMERQDPVEVSRLQAAGTRGLAPTPHNSW